MNIYDDPDTFDDLQEKWDVTLHTDYSGRGMFGRTTFAVSGEFGYVIGFLMDATAQELISADQHPKNMDNLGLDVVVY